MKLHKQLKWLQPYLESVAHMVPLKKLESINLSFYEDTRPYFGLCTAYEGKKFSITIKMPIGVKGKLPLAISEQEEVLNHLSHELAHLLFWEHTTERFLLETFIYHQFAVTLHRLEYEEKRNKVK